VVQADAFNRSRIRTVITVAVTSNVRLADAPGNVLMKRAETGLPKDSVANVSQIYTLDRDFLSDRAGRLSPRTLAAIDTGLRLVLDL
jgi:mRNA interferase MazF